MLGTIMWQTSNLDKQGMLLILPDIAIYKATVNVLIYRHVKAGYDIDV